MRDAFDAYYELLGIPPQDQPPTHYRLLGLSPYESNARVIESAHDRQASHLKSRRPRGEHQAACQRLMDELAVAKMVLLNAARRKAYDAVLKGAGPASALEAAQPAAPTRARPIPIPKDSPRAFTPSGSLAKYKLLEAVAGSAYARTHKAQHVDTGRYYFLKFLPPESLANREIIKRFERECEILIKLDHPNLIVGYESFQHDTMRFLVMEYLLGTDLATLVKQEGPLSVEQAVDYTLQAARGLQAMHASGIYHRNLKPQVLMVDLQGRLRITNLLLAKLGEGSAVEGEALTTMGEPMGSYDYMPPEQAVDARKVDARSDVYALGCTMFHLLLGRPPFLAKGPMDKIMAHRKTPPPSLVALLPDKPAWLDAIFQKMLAKDPAARYQSGDELIAALEQSANSPWKRLLSRLGLR